MLTFCKLHTDQCVSHRIEFALFSVYLHPPSLIIGNGKHQHTILFCVNRSPHPAIFHQGRFQLGFGQGGMYLFIISLVAYPDLSPHRPALIFLEGAGNCCIVYRIKTSKIIDVIIISLIRPGILRCADLYAFHRCGHIQIHLLSRRKNDGVSISILHINGLCEVENPFLPRCQLHKRILGGEMLPSRGIPFPDIIIHQKTNAQRIAVFVQGHGRFVIRLLHLVQSIRIGSRNHIFQSEDICDQFCKTVVTVFIGTCLNSKAFAKIYRGRRHGGGKQDDPVCPQEHVLVAHPAAVDLTPIETGFIGPIHHLFIRNLFLQIRASPHCTVKAHTKNRIAEHLQGHQYKERTTKHHLFQIFSTVKQNQHRIHGQKRDRQKIGIILAFTKPGDHGIDRKSQRKRRSRENPARGKFLHMPPCIKSHGQQKENIDKRETVRKSILHVEPMPDIIQDIHIEACIQQYKEQHFGDALPQADFPIQQKHQTQDHGHRATERIDSDLVIRNIDGFTVRKLTGKLRQIADKQFQVFRKAVFR